MSSTVKLLNSSRYLTMRDSEGSLPWDHENMKLTLDRGCIFNVSADKGLYSTRAIITYKKCALSLDFPGKMYTSMKYTWVNFPCWVTTTGIGDRKICVAVQGRGEKAYALLMTWPLWASGAKSSTCTDQDIYRVKLNHLGSDACVIKSFDEKLTNRPGCMARKNFNTFLKSSHIGPQCRLLQSWRRPHAGRSGPESPYGRCRSET